MRPQAPASSILTLHLLWMAFLLATLTILLLTGCGAGRLIPPSAQPGITLHGGVHGGQQPVAGAHVYLLAANTNGYGGPGIAASTSNASTSLLKSVDTGLSDSLGAYVSTGADGSFDITGDYTCTPGQQVYLYAHGGNPGGGTNSAAGFLAVIGNCPAAGDFSSVPYIEINEVSTVAAAYSFAAFASDATHVSTNGTPQALTGIANAFANAANLVDLGSGIALTSTPAGNGTVPTQTIYTLANILAACVNTSNPIVNVRPGGGTPLISALDVPHNIPLSTTCNTLRQNARSTGSTGLYPNDTATAALYIAQNPATPNLSTLFTLPAPTAPFSPALTAQPNDFTLTLAFTPSQRNVDAMAFDASGNLWYTYGPGIAALTPLGAEAPGSPFTDSSLVYPFSIAIDTSNNIWTADYSAQTLTEFNASGSLLQSTAVIGLSYPTGIAIDPSGDLWISNLFGSVTKTSSSGTLVATYTGSGSINDPFQVFSDASGNIWLPNPNGYNFVLLNNDGTPHTNSPFSASSAVSPNYGYQLAGLDSSGNLWTLNQYSNQIGAISSSGSPLSGLPYTLGSTPGGYGPQDNALTLDGSSSIFAAITDENQDFVHSGPAQPLSTRSASVHPHDLPFQFSTLYAVTSAGNAFLSYALPGIPAALAVDPSGNLWYSVSGDAFYEIIGVATPVETPMAQAVKDNCIAQRPCLPPS